MNTPIFDSLTAKLTIEALDWEHEIPCEAQSHEGQDHKADYLIVSNFCNCPAFALCEERVISKTDGTVLGWRCTFCNVKTRGSFLENHRVIPINNK